MTQTTAKQDENLIGCEIELPLLPDSSEQYLEQRESIWEQMRDALNAGWVIDRDVYTQQITGMTNQDDKRHPGILHDASKALLEFALPPCQNIEELRREWKSQYTAILPVLQRNSVRALGAGMQPDLNPAQAGTYEAWRTPRGYYDLLVQKRRWEHKWLMSTASIQPSVDVPKDRAIEYVNLFEKMSALLQPLTANSPIETWNTVENFTELRGQRCWSRVLRQSVDNYYATSGMPERPYGSLDEYMTYIFSIPLFYIVQKGQTGINKKARHLLPASMNGSGRTPSLKELLTELVEKGRTISAFNLAGEEIRICKDDISPMTVGQIDWYSFRPARLRFKLRQMRDLDELWQAYQTQPSTIMEKTYVEIRNIATQLPGEEMMPCALFTGITRGYEELAEWAKQFPWKDLRCFDKQYGDRFNAWQQSIAGQPYVNISGELLELIAKFLSPEELRYLDGLRERQASRTSPAALTKAAIRQGRDTLLSLLTCDSE